MCIIVDICWPMCVDMGFDECAYIYECVCVSVCVCTWGGCECVVCFPFRSTPKVTEG